MRMDFPHNCRQRIKSEQEWGARVADRFLGFFLAIDWAIKLVMTDKK